MRPIPLTVIKAGLSRLRIKGGARADTLYDLLNGYVTDANTVLAREGSRRVAQLDSSATKGLCFFEDSYHTFASSIVDVPFGFVLVVLVNPTDASLGLSKIHSATPFLGFLYVVAEFTDGSVFHYWLQTSGDWQANTPYKNGTVIEPTDHNGLGYQATRISSPFPSWAPNVARTVGDIVEPTVYNDFSFEVVDTIGSTPRSGTVEPDWPTEDGAQVSEDVNGLASSTATATTPGDPAVPDEVRRRYG